MKKLFAATFLAIYLFSIGGQLMMHEYMSYQAEKFFNEQVSKGRYNINDLTEVKIPVNMPGIAEWPAYENISGQIQFENHNYNYVKMRITRTAMYLMCVPNYNTTKFSDQNIIAAKGCKSDNIPKKNHVPYGKIVLLGYVGFAFTHFTFTAPITATGTRVIHMVQQPNDRFLKIPEQPPKFAC